MAGPTAKRPDPISKLLALEALPRPSVIAAGGNYPINNKNPALAATLTWSPRPQIPASGSAGPAAPQQSRLEPFGCPSPAPCVSFPFDIILRLFGALACLTAAFLDQAGRKRLQHEKKKKSHLQHLSESHVDFGIWCGVGFVCNTSGATGP